VDERSCLCTSDGEIKEAFKGYFDHLFSTSKPLCMELCLENVSKKVTQEMNDQLLKHAHLKK
jgi:hypothetical protein